MNKGTPTERADMATGEAAGEGLEADEATRLWRILEKKQNSLEGGRRVWIGVAVAFGLVVLLTGLWIVVFQ